MGSRHGVKSWNQVMGSSHGFRSWDQVMGQVMKSRHPRGAGQRFGMSPDVIRAALGPFSNVSPTCSSTTLLRDVRYQPLHRHRCCHPRAAGHISGVGEGKTSTRSGHSSKVNPVFPLWHGLIHPPWVGQVDKNCRERPWSDGERPRKNVEDKLAVWAAGKSYVGFFGTFSVVTKPAHQFSSKGCACG